MSAFSKLKLYSRRPVAVIMAALVATSSVPMAPIAQATAAYADEAQAKATASSHASNEAWTNLSENKTITFDAHPASGNGQGTLTIKKADVLTYLKALDWSADFTYTPGGDNAFSKTVDTDLAAVNEDLHKADKSETDKNGVLTKVDTSDAVVDGKPSVDVTNAECSITADNIDSQDISVTGKGDWVLSTGENVSNVKVSVTVKSISYKYSYSYKYQVITTTMTPPAEGDVLASPTIESKAEDQTKTRDKKQKDDNLVIEKDFEFPGKVSSVEAWANSNTEANLNAAAPVVKGLQFTRDSLAPVSTVVFKGLAGLTAEINQPEDDKYYYTPEVVYENGAYSVKVTPKHATTADKTFTISFAYPDGKKIAENVTVTVRPIAQETVDLSMLETDALDFRMADDELSHITEKANEAIKKATGVSDYYEKDGTAIVNKGKYYAANGQSLDGSSDVTFTARNSSGKEDALNDFTFTNQPVVKMKAMVVDSWQKPTNSSLTEKLSLTGTGLKDETFTKPSETWLHTNATAAWADGTLASAENSLNDATTFEKSVEFKAVAQGTQEKSFYVRDSNGIVSKIEGAKYLFDSVTPGLSAFNAVPSGKDYKSSDKKIWASKNMDVEFFANEGDTTETASGINTVTGTYTEKGSSKAAEVKNISSEPAGKDEDGGYKYAFSISADSKVSSDSIKVTLQDKAGNTSKELGYKDATTNIDVAELVALTSSPTIDAAWSGAEVHNGKYYNGNRTLTLTIHAPFFEYTQQYLGNATMATITKDGADWKTIVAADGGWVNQGNDTYTYTVTFDSDGDYELKNVNIQDVLGRSDTAAGDVFTIDKTAPVMQVTFDNNDVRNGKYYNAARTATITVTEHNFDSALVQIEPTATAGNGGEVGQPAISGWSNNGDVHTATVTFPGQGVYTLSVNGEDLATNKMEGFTAPEFVVDTEKPEIKIDNVVNKTAYAGDVAPTVSIHDTNLDSASSIDVSKISYPLSPSDGNPYTNKPAASATDMTVTYTNPDRSKENDGVYTVTVQASDLAGNTDSQAVTWSVNRFGSTYVISDDTGKMIDQFLKSDDTVDVKVTEINPSGLDESKTAVELTRDTKNSTLKSGDDYKTDADSSKGWHEYVYTVDKDNYDADGTYRVLFHSEDAAGNASENTMEGKNAKDTKAAAEVAFAVDDTKPIASFVDLEDGGKYEEAEHKAKVNFEDNLKLDRAEIKVNGKTVAKFDAKQLEANPVKSFTMPGSPDKQDVSVTVWDAAGNESEELKASGVLVTNDALVLWMNNTPLFVGSIAAVVIVAGGIFFLLAKKRKKDEGEAAEA